MRITIATSPAEIDSLFPAWERLYHPADQSVFQNYKLNRLAAEHFRERERPYVVMVESDSSAALVPAAIRESTGELTLLGESLFDYRDVLHVGSHEALEAAWIELSKLDRTLSFVAVHPASQARWNAIPTTNFANAPCVRPQDMDCDEFRAAHNKLGMYYRRIIKRGAHLHAHSGKNRELVRTIYKRKAAQFPLEANNVFLDSHRREFMTLACEALGDACEIFTLEVGAELIAALVTIREYSVRRFYTIYFDPAWSKFSPGVALIYEVTARTLAEGLECDYMTGEYGYKNRLATAMVPLLRVQASAEHLSRASLRARAA